MKDETRLVFREHKGTPCSRIGLQRYRRKRRLGYRFQGAPRALIEPINWSVNLRYSLDNAALISWSSP